MANTMLEIMKYLGTNDRPVPMPEFKEFWVACSEAEREEFKSTELRPLRLTV